MTGTDPTSEGLRAVFMTPYLDRFWIISQFLIAFAPSVPMICDNSIHPTSHEYGSELPSFALRTRKFRNLAKPGVALQNDARSHDNCPNKLTSRLAKPLVTKVPFSTLLFTYILPNARSVIIIALHDAIKRNTQQDYWGVGHFTIFSPFTIWYM